jgi:tRNA-dihydrouridine synthase
MYDPEANYRVRQVLDRLGQLTTCRKFWCRCRTDFGKGNEKTPHYVSVVDGVLKHRTACRHPGHLKDIKQLFYRAQYAEVRNSSIWEDRRMNQEYWAKLPRKRSRVKTYAHRYGLTHKQAALELEWREAMEKAEADALWEEAEFYHPSPEEE